MRLVRLQGRQVPLFGNPDKQSVALFSFSVCAFPTFVLIGSDGVVGRVVSGFGEEARELLFE
ncbi:MAG: hypothetical protein KDD19_24260 [Phaeodactylibacter sp.]|nr:hypothetical protein [Phaeodactylibacter sp.]MCB9054189.1 hypothetical protein [Lewinellaceae bacterium]